MGLIGSEAIEDGTNYYYLSYRVGMAYYMQEKYRKSSEYFVLALSYSSDDKYSLGYLYLSYIYSGRNAEAMLIIKHLTPSQKEYFKIKSIDNISLDFGINSSNNYSENANTYLLTSDTSVFGMKDLTNSFNYYAIGFQHKLFNKMIVNHSFSGLTIDKYKQFEYIESSEIAPGIQNHIYNSKSLNYQLNQKDYYIGISVPLKNGLIISPAFHFIQCNYKKFDIKPVNPSLLLPQKISEYTLIEKDTVFNNFAYSLSITKNYTGLSVTPSAIYSELNGKIQKGGSLSVSIFPKNNLNLYLTSSLSVFNEAKNTKMFVNQTVGFKVTPLIWAEILGSYGDTSDGMENNGFLVYNNNDVTNFNAGANLIFSFKHLEISCRYKFIQKQNKYYSTTISPINNFSTTNNTSTSIYNNNLIIGGIKWKF